MLTITDLDLSDRAQRRLEGLSPDGRALLLAQMTNYVQSRLVEDPKLNPRQAMAEWLRRWAQCSDEMDWMV